MIAHQRELNFWPAAGEKFIGLFFRLSAGEIVVKLSVCWTLLLMPRAACTFAGNVTQGRKIGIRLELQGLPSWPESACLWVLLAAAYSRAAGQCKTAARPALGGGGPLPPPPLPPSHPWPGTP